MPSLLEFFPGDLRIEILDIGAALNDRPPYQSLVEAGRARITGFEPDLAECKRLNDQYGASHQFLPYFAGDGQPAVFHETNWSLTGSLFEPNTLLLEKFHNLAEVVRPVAAHPVHTVRVDDLPDLKDIDFLKLDVQGSELAILENAQHALASALLIQVEVEFVELYRGQPMFADIDTCLRKRGFQFHAFNGFGQRAFKPLVADNDLNKGFRQILWSDANYVRDWMHLDELTDSKLQKYAVLAHDILGSYDLAHLVLSELDRRTGSRLANAYLDILLRKDDSTRL